MGTSVYVLGRKVLGVLHRTGKVHVHVHVHVHEGQFLKALTAMGRTEIWSYLDGDRRGNISGSV